MASLDRDNSRRPRTAGKQIKTLPKSENPSLLGKIETLKAQLWMRLTEREELEPVVVFAKTARIQRKAVGIPTLPIPSKIPEPQGRILRLKEVVRMVGLSRSTIWAWDRDGKSPKHRKLGPRSVGWLDTEVHEWINRRFGCVD